MALLQLRDQLVSLLIVLASVFTVALCYSPEWTWLAGDKMADKLSTHDHPGGRSGSSVWSSNGVAWIFGGSGFTDVGSGKSHLLNDVWSFQITTKKFQLQNPGTWSLRSDLQPRTNVPRGRTHAAMCGNMLNQVCVFGGSADGGVSLEDLWVYNTSSGVWHELIGDKSSASWPSARSHSSVWCHDSSMYLFGGMDDRKQVFADMWRLNLSTFIWEKLHDGDGSNMVDNGIYPAGRNRAATWVSAGTLYMFGGSTKSEFSYALQHTSNLTSDLWRYHPENNTWQLVAYTRQPWMNLGHDPDQDVIWELNYPGGRVDAATWTDTSDNLWLFGGVGVERLAPTNDTGKLLSDIWRFDLKCQYWEFVGGRESGDMPGRYGELGKSSSENLPGARTEMVVWEGSSNFIYIFGGLGYDQQHFGGYLNDLWMVDVTLAFSRDFMISPAIFVSFFGVVSLLLVAIFVVGLYNRQNKQKSGSRLEFRLSPEYYALDSDIAA